MTERCDNFKKAIEEFEKTKSGNISVGTKTVWSEYFAESFTDEEKAFTQKLGYKYTGDGKFSGAFGITDHEFEYIGVVV